MPKSAIQRDQMNAVSMRLYRMAKVVKRNPDSCRIVIGMNAKAGISLKGRIKDKLNFAVVIVENAKRSYYPLGQIQKLGEALLRGKA